MNWMPLSPLPSGNEPERLTDARGLGWNWGGFLIPYLWLLGHGQIGVALLLMASASIPFVAVLHLLLYPMVGIYLGLNGYELAWKHSPYHSVEQLRERERSWTLWGAVVVALFLVAVLMVFAFWAVIATGMREALQDLPG